VNTVIILSIVLDKIVDPYWTWSLAVAVRWYYSTDRLHTDLISLKLKKKKLKTIYHTIKYIMEGQVVSGETIVPYAVFLHNDCGFRPTGCTCRALYWPKTQPRRVVITITAIIIITNIIVIIIIILIVAVVCVYDIIVCVLRGRR